VFTLATGALSIQTLQLLQDGATFSRNLPKTPATLKAINHSTNPIAHRRSQGFPRRPTKASALRGVRGEPLTGVGVSGGAGDLLEFDGLDDHLCDRIRVYPQLPQPLP
jgi:hypothetical protein